MIRRLESLSGFLGFALPALPTGLLALGLVLYPVLPARAADPPSGTLGPSFGASINWVGTSPGGAAVGATFGNHDDLCEEGVTCEHFKLTLSGQPSAWNGLSVRIELRWAVRDVHDYDFYVHKGSTDGPVIASGTRGFTDFERDDIEPAVNGTGDFFVHVVYFTATAADQYRGSAAVITEPPGVPPAPIAAGPPPRYQSHTPTAEQITAGLSRNSQDEPNIGVNWKTGKVMLQALLQTLRVGFSDQTCPQTPASDWEDKSPQTSVTSFDPILFTDHATGRTFVSHLLLNPFASASSFTDNDGDVWTPSQGAGAGSGVDHQTIGGGPFHAAAPPSVGYPNAVYYCAQDIAFATCALSQDGGLTYGPAVPMYDLRRCAGLHGHVKVGPDGTVYVPNGFCTGQQNPTEHGVAVSEDNGVTWAVRTVPGSVAGGGSDPSVAVDDGGRLYFGFVNADENPAAAVSDDHGRTWTNVFDVGAMLGVKNAVFPAVVAGEFGRAAMAFYGNTTDGPANNFNSLGVWHLYVAHTFDGGASWITVNATPDEPLQRGGIHLGGGSHIHRNLLDFFDADVDAEGRVVVGYADGCLGTCVQAPADARGNSYTAFGTIARQTGGRRLFAQFDPPEPTVPGAPRLTVTRNGSLATLTWSQSEDGGSPITGYKIFRRASGGAEQLLASVDGSTRAFVDQSGDPRVTYAYRVVAANGRGGSCGTNEAAGKPVGSSCIAPGIRVVEDRLRDQVGEPADPDMDIEWVAIGEPFLQDGSQQLVFTLKVRSLNPPPPSRMWRILWNYPDAPRPPQPTSASFVGRYYVGMSTDSAGAVSFEYGIVRNQSLVVANVLPPTRLGGADPESTFSADGTITIVISTSKVGGPRAGDLVGGLIARTFPVRQNNTLRSDSAADSATFASTYILVGNAFCENPPPTINCFEDDAPEIAYSNGWHRKNEPDASAGHFRFNAGKDRNHGMSFTFEVPEGATGALVYHFARSTKGGTADVYIDGILRETISYRGAAGSLRHPQFGFSAHYAGLGAGTRVFELRNLQGPAFVDRFCLENAFSSAMPATGPGPTSSRLEVLGAAQSLLDTVTVAAGASAISVVAGVEAALPIRLVLLDPAGGVLGTVESSDGLAVIERDISQVGVYQVQVLNLGLQPVEVWTATTPFGAR